MLPLLSPTTSSRAGRPASTRGGGLLLASTASLPPALRGPAASRPHPARSVAVGRGLSGWGLFAMEALSPGDVVCEYLGEAVRAPLADVREGAYGFADGGTYMFRVGDAWVVDATQAGGPARFINHSCAPNCDTQAACVPVCFGGGGGGEDGGEDGGGGGAGDGGIRGRPRVAVVANRAIEPGEELTYAYNFEEEADAPALACRCGAATCRGRLN